MSAKRGGPYDHANLPAIVALVHVNPGLRSVFPIAEALDMAVRWNA